VVQGDARQLPVLVPPGLHGQIALVVTSPPYGPDPDPPRLTRHIPPPGRVIALMEEAMILVTGGTGRLGRKVVRRLRAEGREVRVLSRREGAGLCTGDLATGAGIDAALAGVGVVVHCATSTRGDAEATRNLVQAATRAGKPHLVYVSIVGIDAIASWSYPKAKLDCERLVMESGLPWTVLRVTQFHEYVLAGARKLAWLPVVPAPAGFHIRPVDTGEVADRLAELALGGPAGRVPDLAGPEVTDWVEVQRGYLRASGKRRLVVPVRIPGTRAVRAGGLLPAGEFTVGRRTWRGYLSETLAG
jgi:uncharacterized protein YbjT (DUF2867 family)